MKFKQIYLDYNSSTPTDERVVEAMLPYFNQHFGNASSVSHQYGQEAKGTIERSKTIIKRFFDSENTGDVIFTSGATESINLALRGVIASPKMRGNHIITTQTEHKAVLETCNEMRNNGVQVTFLPVKQNGMINVEELEECISPSTALISIIWANNETGVIQNMEEISKIAKKHSVLLMSDATQAIGKTEVNLNKVEIDLLAFSGHKIYGPKGIGGLFLSESALKSGIMPQITGGGQQRSLRSGTLNTPGIVGLAKAFEIFSEEMNSEIKGIEQLRNKFENGLKEEISHNVSINGERAPRISNTSNVGFEGISSEKIILQCRELAISSGSACESNTIAPSHVLKAMGLSENLLNSSVRFSLGRFTTTKDIEIALNVLASI